MADSFIKILKEKHPTLAALVAKEDKELVKLKVPDAKVAVKTALALNIIRLLQQYKQVDEAPYLYLFFINISNNIRQPEK